MVRSYFQLTRPDCKIESFYTTGRQRKMTASVLIAFVLIAKLCSKQWVAFVTFVHVKRCDRLAPKKVFSVVVKKIAPWTEPKLLTRKGFTVIEIGECEWWTLLQDQQKCQKSYPRKLSLCFLPADQVLEEIKSGILFGYVKCAAEVHENLKFSFSSLFPIFKITLVSQDFSGVSMKTYVEEKRWMSVPRKMLISSFTLQNGTLITPLLSLYLHRVFVVTKRHRFFQ